MNSFELPIGSFQLLHEQRYYFLQLRQMLSASCDKGFHKQRFLRDHDNSFTHLFSRSALYSLMTNHSTARTLFHHPFEQMNCFSKKTITKNKFIRFFARNVTGHCQFIRWFHFSSITFIFVSETLIFNDRIVVVFNLLFLL